MKVNNENISFIIQGPIIQPSKNSPFSTVNSINNLRHIFPKSEIIVSTWENTHINNIDYDHIVLSKDPGAISFTKKGITYNNVNRQIVSTLAGLRVATRPYVVKMRGDILVTGKNFISIFETSFDRQAKMKIFNYRIVNLCYYFRNPYIFPLLYHPGDIFQFGTRDDLIKLWDIPLAPEPETSRWMKKRKELCSNNLLPNNLYRYTPEQYIWISCLNKHGYPQIQLYYPTELKSEEIHISELSIANNFIIASPHQMNIKIPKRLKVIYPFTIYYYKDWLLLQKKYCTNSFSFADQCHLYIRKILLKLLFFGYIKLGKLSHWTKNIYRKFSCYFFGNKNNAT